MMPGATQRLREARQGIFLSLIAMLMCCALVGRTHAAGDELIGAASEKHLWLVLEPRGKSAFFDLVHHPADEEGWFYRTQHTMTQPPAAMAAIDDGVWLVMPARKLGDSWRREVFTAHVERNPATGLYYTVPAGRLEMLSPMEGLGRLVGFVATKHGPVALLVPSPRSNAAAVPSAAGDSQPSGEAGLGRPMLLRLAPEDEQWSELPLPEEFIGSRDAQIGVAGDKLVILEAIGENPARSKLFMRNDDGTWETASHPFDARNVHSLTQVAGQVVAVVTGRTNENRLELMFLRPAGPMVLGSIEQPDGRSATLGFDGKLTVVERERGDEDEPAFAVRTIDPLTAAVSQAAPFTRQPLTAGRMWQLTLALGLSLSAVLAIVLLRPAPAGSITVDQQRILPIGRRLTALAIDLVIAAVPTMLLLECGPGDLLRLPVLSTEMDRGGPYLAWMLITSAICTLFECGAGASVGKLMIGARIAALDGSRPPLRRVLVRGVLRLMVLLVPPLAVLALTNSHMQGLPDLAARTLVVTSPADAETGREGEDS